MKSRLLAYIICIAGFFGTCNAQSSVRQNKQDPSVLVIMYMAARNDLAMYAETHIRQLLELGSTDRVKIFVHLDVQKDDEQNLTRNFFVGKNKLFPVGDLETKDSGKKETLIEAAQLAYDEFPADEVVLVLWNHGTGAVEPRITLPIHQWEIWRVDERTGKLSIDQSVGYLDRICPGEGSFEDPKGICFDDATGSYLRIEELHDAIATISEDIIKKKFSIIACDACLMAGADVFLGFEDYADYFVASQEVELGLGYRYDLIVEPLVKNTVCCGEELACHFVNAYKEYYDPKIDWYTHMAFDLSYNKALEFNIAMLATCLEYGLEHQYQGSVKEAIRLSRHKKQCIRFTEPSYIDLCNFYTNMLAKIEYNMLANGKTEQYKKALHAILTEGLAIMKTAVKANVAGEKYHGASGVSIYFPEFTVHRSYKENLFAKRSRWVDFLMRYCESS